MIPVMTTPAPRYGITFGLKSVKVTGGGQSAVHVPIALPVGLPLHDRIRSGVVAPKLLVVYRYCPFASNDVVGRLATGIIAVIIVGVTVVNSDDDIAHNGCEPAPISNRNKSARSIPRLLPIHKYVHDTIMTLIIIWPQVHDMIITFNNKLLINITS